MEQSTSGTRKVDTDPEPEPQPLDHVTASTWSLATNRKRRIDPRDGILKTKAEYIITYRCEKCTAAEQETRCKDCDQQAAVLWETAEKPDQKRVDPRDGVEKDFYEFLQCYGTDLAYDQYASAVESEGHKGQSLRFEDAKLLDTKIADVTASHYRTFCCRKEGGLSGRDTDILTNVTFLSAAEIKQVELVFNRIVEDVESQSRLTRRAQDGVRGLEATQNSESDAPVQIVTRFGIRGGQQVPVQVKALSTDQLRTYLPEFTHNVFFDRLVRVFSETGEQLLTLLELIDLYSALSPRTPTKWKCKILFCVFDFDEDDILDKQDLTATIGRMVHGTHTSALSRKGKNMMEKAAVNIQKLYRGFRARRALTLDFRVSLGTELEKDSTDADTYTADDGRRKEPKKAVHIVQSVNMLERLADAMVEGCTIVQKEAMDYSFFESLLLSFPYFDENISVNITKPKDLEKMLQKLHNDPQSAHDEQLACSILRCYKTPDDPVYTLDDDSHAHADTHMRTSSGTPLDGETSPTATQFLDSPSSPGASPGSSVRSSTYRSGVCFHAACKDTEVCILEQVWRRAHPHFGRDLNGRGHHNGWKTRKSHEKNHLAKTCAIDMFRFLVPKPNGELRTEPEARELFQELVNVRSAANAERAHNRKGALAKTKKISVSAVDLDQGDYIAKSAFFEWFEDKYIGVDDSANSPWRCSPQSGHELDTANGCEWMLILAARALQLSQTWESYTNAPNNGLEDPSGGIGLDRDAAMSYACAKSVCEHMWVAQWQAKRASKFAEFYVELTEKLWEREQNYIAKAAKTKHHSNGKLPRTSEKQNMPTSEQAHRAPSQTYLEQTLFAQWDSDANKGHQNGGLLLSGLEEQLKELLGRSCLHEAMLLMHLIDPHGGAGQEAYVHVKDLAFFFAHNDSHVRTQVAELAIPSLAYTAAAAVESQTAAGETSDTQRDAYKIAHRTYVWDWTLFAENFEDFWGKLTVHEQKGIMASDTASCSVAFEDFARFFVCGGWYPFIEAPFGDRIDDQKDTDAARDFGRKVSDAVAARMVRAAHRVKWRESMKTAQMLWNRYDTNRSGWISRDESKQLIGEVPSQYGQCVKMLPHGLFAQSMIDLSEVSTEISLHESLDSMIDRLRRLGVSSHPEKGDEHLESELVHAWNKLSNQGSLSEDIHKPGILLMKRREVDLLVDTQSTRNSRAELEDELEGWEKERKDLVRDITGACNMLWLTRRHREPRQAHRIVDEEATKKGEARYKVYWPGGDQKKEWLSKKDLARLVSGGDKSVDDLLESWDLQKQLKKQHDKVRAQDLVRKDVFMEWWTRRYWIVKEYTYKVMMLHEIWQDMDGTRDGFKVWKARAVLSILWNVDENTYRTRSVFHRRFVSWWHDHDPESTGFVIFERFAGWWVLQPERVLDRAFFDGQTGLRRNWRHVDLNYNREVMDEFGAMLAEVDGGFDDEKDRRERDLDQAMRELDADISHSDQKIEEGRRSATWRRVRRHIFRTDQAPFGVLSGGTRPPMLKTRLRLFGTVRTEELNALRDDWTDRTGCTKAVHNCFCRVNLRKERALLARSRHVSGAYEQNTFDQSIGEILGDFQVHKHRFCIDTHWIRDTALWIEKHLVEAARNMLHHDLDGLEREFGRGAAEILRRGQFMLNLTTLISVLWMSLVIVPRDYVEGGGAEGMLNTTKAVVSGLVFEPDTGKKSLFYDGYSKQPFDLLGVPLRADLLYFISIVGTALLSLAAILRSMGENFGSIAQGSAQLTVSLDPNAHGPGTILGRYQFGRLKEQNEENMRQRIREAIDQWLQSYKEDQEVQAIADVWWKRLRYDSKMLLGIIATGVVLVVDIALVSWILVSQDMLLISFGDNDHVITLGLASELLISLLDLAMSKIIPAIVKAEKHTRKSTEHSKLLQRVFLTKIVNLGAILYSVASVSHAGEGSFYETATSRTTCQEAEFGDIFLKLLFADALVTVVRNYGNLYAVNHGLPRPNYWFITREFQHTADKSRLAMFAPGWGCCTTRVIKFDSNIPGEIQGTDWEIRWVKSKGGSETGASAAGEYVFIKSSDRLDVTTSGSVDDLSGIEHLTKMPRDVKNVLSRTYRLQKRIVPAPTLSLTKRLMHEKSEGARVQWWKRRIGKKESEPQTDDGANNLNLFHGWATSAAMQKLTGNSLRPVQLGVCAWMLTDAGYKSKQHIIDLNHNPQQLADAMLKRRGRHKYKYKSPQRVKEHRQRQAALAKQQNQALSENLGPSNTDTRLEAFMHLSIEMESITDGFATAVDEFGHRELSLASKEYLREKFNENAADDSDTLDVNLVKKLLEDLHIQFVTDEKLAADQVKDYVDAIVGQTEQQDKPITFEQLWAWANDESTWMFQVLKMQARNVQSGTNIQEQQRRCLVVLEHGFLSYYETKDPRAAFDEMCKRKTSKHLESTPAQKDKHTENSHLGDRLNAAELTELCHQTLGRLGKHTREIHQTMTDMCGDEGSATADDFDQWWHENAGKWVAKQRVSGVVDVSLCEVEPVVAEPPKGCNHIRMKSGRRTVTLTPIATPEDGMTTEVSESLWLTALQACVAPSSTSNWGPQLQRVPGQNKNGDHALERTRLLRMAEEHTAAAHNYASGARTAHIHNLFDEFDVDGNGFLATNELKTVVQRLYTAQRIAGRERELREAENRSAADPHNHDLTEELQLLRKKHEEQTVDDDLTEKELLRRIKKIPQRVSGLVDFEEFMKWWQHQDGAHKLSHHTWQKRNIHASREYELAIEIYDQLLVPLNDPSLEETVFSSSTELNLTGLDADGHSGLSLQDAGSKQHDGTANLDSAQREKVLKQWKANRKKYRKKRGAGTLNYSDSEMMKGLRVLLTRKRILELCKDAQDALTTHTIKRDFHGNTMESRKAVDIAAALLAYQTALAEDELNVHLQRRCSQMIRYVNRSANAMTHKQILDFTTELVRTAGNWEEVTTEVEQQRFWRAKRKKLGASASADLLTSMLYRQSLIWVGTAWCPWLPVVGVMTQYAIAQSVKDAIVGTKRFPQGAYYVSGAEWAAPETHTVFTSLSLVMLLVCALPILVWLNQEPTCGPHNADVSELPDGTCIDGIGLDGTCEGTGAKVFETFGVYLDWLEKRRIEHHMSKFLQVQISEIAALLVSPPVLIIVLCVMHTRHQYLKAAYNNLHEKFERNSTESKHKEKVLTEVMRSEKMQQAEARASTILRHKIRKDTSPEEIRAARLMTLRKCFVALDHDLRDDQFTQTRQFNTSSNQELDDLTRAMDSTGLLARAFDKSPTAVQEQLALASGHSLGLHDSSKDDNHATILLWLMAASTVVIRNIDFEFAKPRVIEKVLMEKTHGRVLACTVYSHSHGKIASNGYVSAHNAEMTFGYKSIFPDYPHGSWALVTFASKRSASTLCRHFGLQSVNLDPNSQPYLGSWHAVSWNDATDMLDPTVKAKEEAYEQARAQAIEAALGRGPDAKQHAAELQRVEAAAAANFDYVKGLQSRLAGVPGEIGAPKEGTSQFMRRHNNRLKVHIGSGLLAEDLDTRIETQMEEAATARKTDDDETRHAHNAEPQEDSTAYGGAGIPFVNPLTSSDTFEDENRQPTTPVDVEAGNPIQKDRSDFT